MNFLLSILGGAWSLIQRGFESALRYPWQAALIASLALAGWLYMGKQSALDTVAARNATIAAMTKASDDATAAQIAANKAVTDKQTDIARKADNAKTDIIDRGRAYADSLRGKDYCREANSPAESGIAASDNAASDTAVVLERADYDILVANTARLVAANAWGDDLIAQGLAVSVEENQP